MTVVINFTIIIINVIKIMAILIYIFIVEEIQKTVMQLDYLFIFTWEGDLKIFELQLFTVL